MNFNVSRVSLSFISFFYCSLILSISLGSILDTSCQHIPLFKSSEKAPSSSDQQVQVASRQERPCPQSRTQIQSTQSSPLQNSLFGEHSLLRFSIPKSQAIACPQNVSTCSFLALESRTSCFRLFYGCWLETRILADVLLQRKFFAKFGNWCSRGSVVEG